MASIGTAAAASAVSSATVGTAAATAGAFASAGLAIGGALIDQYVISPMLAGSVDSQTFTTDIGSVRLSTGDESTPVPRVLGEFNRVQGVPIWSSIPKSRRRVERIGKRGEQVEFSWLQSAAFAVAGNQLTSVTRVLADGTTVYDTRPPRVREFVVNDDTNGDGVTFNYNRFIASEGVQYTGGGAFQYSLYHLAMESVPELLEEFTISDGFGLGQFTGGFTEGGFSRFLLARSHGLNPGDSLPVRIRDVTSRILGSTSAFTDHLNDGYWTWGIVPDVPDSDFTIDVRANNDNIFVPAFNTDRRREIALGPNAVLEMDFRRPKASDQGEHQFLSSFDAGAPVLLENITTGDGWEDPGFEVVASREIGGRRHQLILDMNDVYVSPPSAQNSGLLYRWESQCILHRANSQGTRSVEDDRRDAINEPIPFEQSEGDVIRVTQENQTDDEFAETWELPFETTPIEDQTQSVVISEEVTPFELPAFRGLSVVAAKDINTAGTGSRVPNMEFFASESLNRTLSSALIDIAEEWGVTASTNVGSEILKGMTWSGRVEGALLMEQLSMAFDLVVKEDGFGTITIDKRTSTTVWDLDDLDLNPDKDRVFIPLDDGRRIQFVGDDVGSRPSSLSLQYIDTDDDLNRGLVTERLASSPAGQSELSMALSISMTNSEARDVARRLLKSFHNWVPVRFNLPSRFGFIRENDYITISVFESVPGSAGSETYGRLLRILVSRIDEGADLVLRCEGKITSFDRPKVEGAEEDAASPDFAGIPEESGFPTSFASSQSQSIERSGVAPSGATARVLGGPSLRPEDAGRVGYYVAATSTDPNADFVPLQVFKSVDDGLNWEKIGDIAPATMGRVIGSPPASDAAEGAWSFDDPRRQPLVEIDGSQVLGNASDLALAAGRNKALISSHSGDEVVQFKDAIPQGESAWRLKSLTRGLLGTSSVDHRILSLVDGSGVNTSVTSVRFLLIDDAVTFFPVPQEEQGQTHLIRVVPRGGFLDNAQTQSVDVPAYSPDQGVITASIAQFGRTGATQNLGGSNGTTNYVDWTQQIRLDDGFSHDTATNPSRITVEADGRYYIKATVSTETPGGNRKTLRGFLRVNGVDLVDRAAGRNYTRGSNYGDLTVNLVSELDLTAGDYIEVGTQVDDADDTQNCNTINDQCELIVRQIEGPAALQTHDIAYHFGSTDATGTPTNTVAFDAAGGPMTAATAQFNVPYDLRAEKLVCEVRAFAGGSDMVIRIKDDISTLWTSPPLGAMTFDYTTRNVVVLDISGLTISAGSGFHVELHSPTTAVNLWSMNVGVIGSWRS